MLVLGLDTSTSVAGIGLVDLDGTLAELRVNLKTDYSEKLLPSIDYLLSLAGLDINDLSGFGISIGPGSFTGLRIGLATIKGLAYATGKPIVAVPTLDAIAWQFQYAIYPIASILDARKKEIYVALYKKHRKGIKRITPYLAMPPKDLPKIIKNKTFLAGPGVSVFKEEISRILKDKALFLKEEICYISGEAVARIGIKKLLAGEVENTESLEPLYVRETDAQLKSFKAKS